jgi:hypothetical protein
MNTTYTLTEGNDALNRVLLMMRYEMGKTLSENVILEQPEEKSDTPYNKELMRKYNKPSTVNMTFDEFMEEYRANLFSIGGMAIEAFLTQTGYGTIPVVAAWGFLLWYDVKKGIDTGNWDWGNLVIDILMVASAGVLGFGLKAIASSGKLVGKGLSEIIEILVKTKGGEKIVEFLRILSTKSGEIIKAIKPGLGWFSKSIVAQGAKWLSKSTLNVIKKALQGVGFVISKVGVLIDKMSVIIEKQLNKVGVTGKLGKGLGAAGGITAFNLSIKAIEEIHNKWVQMGKDAQLEKDVMKYIIVDNQNIYGKDIYYDYKGFKMKKSPNGVFYFYDDKEWVINDETSYNDNQAKLENYYMFRTDLKFNQFKILDKNKKIYEINNKKYQAPKDGWKLKEIK